MPQPSDFRPFSLANTIKGAQDIQFNALTIQGLQQDQASRRIFRQTGQCTPGALRNRQGGIT